MFTAHVIRPRSFIIPLLAIPVLNIFPTSLLASDPTDPQQVLKAQRTIQENGLTRLDRAVTLTDPNQLSLSDWEQRVQDTIDSRDYRPVLNYLQEIPNNLLAQQIYSQAKHIYENTVLRSPTSDDAFYAKKGLLFLQICKKDSDADLTIEQFRREFSGHPQHTIALREAADLYYYRGDQFSKARDLYQEILNKASNEESLLSQRGLTMASIRLGDLKTANAAADRLLSVHGSDSQIALAVREVADAYYYYTEDYYKAGELYQWIDQHGSGAESMWVQRGLVMTHLRQADYAAADAALEKLRSDYANHPRLALALHEAADAYFYVGNDPSRARQVYEQILQDCPECTESMWAQRGLALTALDLGDKADADTAVKQLLSNYTNHPQIAFAIREVADRYFYQGNDPVRACALYQCILLYWPESLETMAAQRGLAMAKVLSGENEIAKEAAEKLLSDYADRPELSERTAEVICQYCRAGKTGEVIALSEKILSQNPGPAMRLAAYTGLAQAYIQLGQQEKVDEIINILITNFSEEKRIGYSLFVIGEEYYLIGEKQLKEIGLSEGRAALQQAISIWQHVRAQSMDLLHQAHAIYYSADALRRIGAYKQAVVYYQQIVSRKPVYKKAWYAQYMIARCCEELAKENKITSGEVKAAYQLVVDKYPDSPAAKIAASKLTLF